MIPSEAIWEALARRRGNALVVPSMTSVRNWSRFSTDPELDFPNLPMGKGSSVGLGLALARPERKVIVLDGDGSLLMNLGSLVTIANMRPKNYLYLLFQNGIYESTGGQILPGADLVDFAAIARDTGWPRIYAFAELADWEARVDEVMSGDGPTFVRVTVSLTQPKLPLPARTTSQAYREVKARLLREDT
jgi:sulfopyruvate decarboxylase subunit beta